MDSDVGSGGGGRPRLVMLRRALWVGAALVLAGLGWGLLGFGGEDLDGRQACGLRPDGELDCWGLESENSAPPPGPFATAPITAAAAGP